MNGMNTRPAITAAVVLALAAPACGNGGSGVAARTVPAGRWASTLCGNLERYGHATTRPFLVFQGLHLEFAYGVPKRSDVRTKQMRASAAIVRATDELIADVQAAGVPRTAHGKPLTDQLVSALRELRDSVAHVHDEATSLPAGSGRADEDAELSPQIGAALGQLATRLRAAKAANGAGLDLSCGRS
jgi:hypothetical protein